MNISKNISASRQRSGNRGRRRLVILLVIVFVALVSYFVGINTSRKPYINPDAIGSNTGDPSGRAGIPPDSLPH